MTDRKTESAPDLHSGQTSTRPARPATLRRDADEVKALFREGRYPYKSRIRRAEYEAHKERLQVELLKVQSWVKETGHREIIPVREHHLQVSGTPDLQELTSGQIRKMKSAMCSSPTGFIPPEPINCYMRWTSGQTSFKVFMIQLLILNPLRTTLC